MSKAVKLTKCLTITNQKIENTIYIMVDNILYFEACEVDKNTIGSKIFFNSVVGQDYAPIIVSEHPDVISNLINNN